ncbi:hypothetical protein THIOM_003364 [Candidatus Thiomargarita nelsonii]|uniref:Uncharacterized protein n=1 Tax=Candidatus Thiomargarita nelsonii TaxID=1003181 RepID=A0A176RYX9_9GAMM|nr:hypothetical protein THIOM_003364 [Candidatus Thiomargarita nelsonii]
MDQHPHLTEWKRISGLSVAEIKNIIKMHQGYLKFLRFLYLKLTSMEPQTNIEVLDQYCEKDQVLVFMRSEGKGCSETDQLVVANLSDNIKNHQLPMGNWDILYRPECLAIKAPRLPKGNGEDVLYKECIDCSGGGVNVGENTQSESRLLYNLFPYTFVVLGDKRTFDNLLASPDRQDVFPCPRLKTQDLML